MSEILKDFTETLPAANGNDKDEKAPEPGPLDLVNQLAVDRVGYPFQVEFTGPAPALDPNTGEVLLLYSHPSFDPNLFVGGIDPATWATSRAWVRRVR